VSTAISHTCVEEGDYQVKLTVTLYRQRWWLGSCSVPDSQLIILGERLKTSANSKNAAGQVLSKTLRWTVAQTTIAQELSVVRNDTYAKREGLVSPKHKELSRDESQVPMGGKLEIVVVQ
jgi:hypothetical protein